MAVTNPNDYIEFMKPNSMIMKVAKSWEQLNDTSKEIVRKTVEEFEQKGLGNKSLYDIDFL